MGVWSVRSLMSRLFFFFRHFIVFEEYGEKYGQDHYVTGKTQPNGLPVFHAVGRGEELSDDNAASPAA